MTGSLHIEQTLDTRDVWDWSRLNTRNTKAFWFRFYFGLYVAPVIGVALVLAAATIAWTIPAGTGKHWSDWLSSVYLGALGAFLMWRTLRRKAIARKVLKNYFASPNVSVTFTPENIRTAGKGLESTIDYSAITKVLADKKVILLYMAQFRFLPVLDRNLKPGQREQIRAYLAQNAPLLSLPKEL